MQYLVHTNGKAITEIGKTYSVKAPNNQVARQIAKESFQNDFCSVGEVQSNTPDRRTPRAILACILMFIPILLSYIGWTTGHETISIHPDMISCLYAVLLYSSFVVKYKGIRGTFSSVADVFMSVIVILLLSTFIRILLMTTTFDLFGLLKFNFNSQLIIPIIVVASVIGLKPVSAFCIMFVGLLSLFGLSSLNKAMGAIAGPVYIISAFCGLGLYLSVEPAVREIIPGIANALKVGINYTKSEIVSGIDSTKATVKSISENTTTKE